LLMNGLVPDLLDRLCSSLACRSSSIHASTNISLQGCKLLHVEHCTVALVNKLHGPPRCMCCTAVFIVCCWLRHQHQGALDVKIGVVGLLEAATTLINQGFSPHRTLMFAFGHDEEVGGTLGAAAIAKHLTQQGVQFEFIWDEGSSVMSDGFPPLVSEPFAPWHIREAVPDGARDVTQRWGHSSIRRLRTSPAWLPGWVDF